MIYSYNQSQNKWWLHKYMVLFTYWFSYVYILGSKWFTFVSQILICSHLSWLVLYVSCPNTQYYKSGLIHILEVSNMSKSIQNRQSATHTLCTSETPCFFPLKLLHFPIAVKPPFNVSILRLSSVYVHTHCSPKNLKWGFHCLMFNRFIYFCL